MPLPPKLKKINARASEIQKSGGKKDNGKGCQVFKINRAQAVKKAAAELNSKSVNRAKKAREIATGMGGSPSTGFDVHEIAKDMLALHNKSHARASLLKVVSNLEIAVAGKRGDAMALVRNMLKVIKRAATKLKAGQMLPITILADNRKLLLNASKKPVSKNKKSTTKKATGKKSKSVAGVIF